MSRRASLAAISYAAILMCIAAPVRLTSQTISAAAAAGLEVTGDVRTPLALSPEDLKAMPRRRVDVKDENGRTVVYDGVLVGEILKRAGARVGSDMRGNAVSTYVVASASDGYQVVFSLAELDPALTGSDVIVADTIDGKPLLERQGPLRIVVPRDTRAARSIRMLRRLEVVQLKK